MDMTNIRNENERKIYEAKKYLGERYVLHSNYKFLKHHSRAHRQSFVLMNYLAQRGAIMEARV